MPLGPVIVMPEFPFKSNELDAAKVAPPLNVRFWIPAQEIVGEPVATDIVAAVPFEEALESRNALELEEPAQVKAFVIVTVAPAEKIK